MSRGAVANRDRRREVRELPMTPEVAAVCEPGTRAFKVGGCQALVSQQRVGWHLSISRPDRLPTWEEVRDARYALVPDEAVMALLLPPRDEYVNVHAHCLQLYEIPASYMTEKDRL